MNGLNSDLSMVEYSDRVSREFKRNRKGEKVRKEKGSFALALGWSSYNPINGETGVKLIVKNCPLNLFSLIRVLSTDTSV